MVASERRPGPARLRGLLVGLGLAASLLSALPAAAAGPNDKSAAARLVTTGQTAMKTRRWTVAEAAFRHAEELDPSPATKVELARSLAQQGKLVEASRTLHAALDAAKGVAAARKAGHAAQKLLGEVEPRVPWIQLVVQGPLKPAQTLIDGKVVDASVELPYDPGEHTIAAEADGFDRVQQKIALVEGAHAKLTLEMKKATAARAPDAPPEEVSSGKGSVLPAVVGFGVGGAGLALGAVFGVMAFGEKSKADDAKAGYTKCVNNPNCPGTTARGYTNDFNAAIDTSTGDGTISTIGFIVGGVGVAAGVTFLFWRPWGGGNAADKAMTVTPTLGMGRVGLTGTF